MLLLLVWNRYSEALRVERVGFYSRQGQETFSHNVQNGSEAHQASHSVGTGALSFGIKLPRHEIEHSSPTGAEVKNDGAEPPILLPFT
jgi:hypothetical protein